MTLCKDAGVLDLRRDKVQTAPLVAPWEVSDNVANNIRWHTTLETKMTKSDPNERKANICREYLKTLEAAEWEVWTDGSVKEGAGRGGGGAHLSNSEGTKTVLKIPAGTMCNS